MTKREIRKKSQEAILKEGKTHQEAFDELRMNPGTELETLAEEIAKIPSPSRMALTANLRNSLMVLLGLNIVLRAITVIAVGSMYEFHIAIILPLILLGIVVPVLGIWAAIKGTYHQLNICGMLIIIGVLRSLKDTDFTDLLTQIILVLVAATAGLCFFVAYKIKMPYTKTAREVSNEGVMSKQLNYLFEDKSTESEELLDR